MNFETSRVYRDIIEEVCQSLHEESEQLHMSPKEIQDLNLSWGRKLRDMTQPVERGSFNFRAIQEEKTNVDYAEDRSSEGDSDERLEQLHPNYMMCLYVKVDKNKHKWKVKLKQGFLNIGKSEFVFDTGHGDLTWC